MALQGQWYKNAIIYCLAVETFADSDGDGIGDFRGLTQRLDYLAGLGVTCLWLMPFYPSPGRDDGYDVADYTAVDPRYGTMADFCEFMTEAGERGMRVLVDLVPNHTSIEHPWFQKAREDPTSRYRDYYIWRDDDPGDTSDQVVFPGEQEVIWTWDDKVQAWYLHHFYEFQPDLNFANPEVREEFRRIIQLWLQLGADGFRVDAAPFLIDISVTNCDSDPFDLDQAYEFLAELRRYVTVKKGDAILLGEVDEGLSTIADYFGRDNQLHALFNFPLNRYLFLGLAQKSADPIAFGLDQLPSIPGSGQWVSFLRHHDELNLSRMTRRERDEIIAAFGPDPAMQIYGRGLRRRLAPMLGGDVARLKMANNLLFSLPGAPMIYYGEEIGMGDQPALPGRMAVRAPMQWTDGPNGGFSDASAERLSRPPLADGPLGYRQINVRASRANRDSLLNWMAALIRVRKETGEIGTGEWTLPRIGNEAIFGIRYDDGDVALVILTNLSDTEQTCTLALEDWPDTAMTDLFQDQPYAPVTTHAGEITLGAYGYRWFRVGGDY